MTDKSPEIELIQLKKALKILAHDLQSLANFSAPKPSDNAFEQGNGVGRQAGFGTGATAINTLLDWVKTFSDDASDKDIENMTRAVLNDSRFAND